MPEPIRIETRGLRTGSAGLEHVGERVDAILAKLMASAAMRGTPWGTDKPGKQFAEGNQGYITGRSNLFGSLKANAERMQDQAKGLRETAVAFEVTEAENKRQL
ncbi:hypothetical protein [Nocardia sp. NPDC052566]|uniref:hypothetical protein n=1 Tax=Nocardia sp. NPDC052566 TaxID=3364330 RepID=UPI0037C977A6